MLNEEMLMHLIRITSFDFVFTLHLIREIMGMTNYLSLQRQSQDILKDMHLVPRQRFLFKILEKMDGDHSLRKV